MTEMLRKPSAWVPMVMSFLALVVLLGYVVLFGLAQQADESTAARLFQILMIGQVPIIGFFAIKYLGRASVPVFLIILLQIAAALLPLASLFFFEM